MKMAEPVLLGLGIKQRGQDFVVLLVSHTPLAVSKQAGMAGEGGRGAGGVFLGFGPGCPSLEEIFQVKACAIHKALPRRNI